MFQQGNGHGARGRFDLLGRDSHSAGGRFQPDRAYGIVAFDGTAPLEPAPMPFPDETSKCDWAGLTAIPAEERSLSRNERSPVTRSIDRNVPVPGDATQLRTETSVPSLRTRAALAEF